MLFKGFRHFSLILVFFHEILALVRLLTYSTTSFSLTYSTTSFSLTYSATSFSIYALCLFLLGFLSLSRYIFLFHLNAILFVSLLLPFKMYSTFTTFLLLLTSMCRVSSTHFRRAFNRSPSDTIRIHQALNRMCTTHKYENKVFKSLAAGCTIASTGQRCARTANEAKTENPYK